MDHCLLLHFIVDFMLHSKKYVYCTFVDYQKAFDTKPGFVRGFPFKPLGIYSNIPAFQHLEKYQPLV